MLHALSLGPETLEADPGWFFTMQSTGGSEGSGDVPVTQELTPTGGNRVLPTPLKPLPVEAVEGPSTVAKQSSETVPPANRFVEVSEDELGMLEEDEPRPPMFSWETGALVAALLLVGFTIWWFLQPPTADSLYARIKAGSSGGSPASIEKEVRDFLNRYSGDPRAEEVREYEREIDLDNLEQKFKSRLKGWGDTDNLQPIDRAYLEAQRYLQIDKDLCARKLQAIIDLYGDRGNNPESPGLCLTLAQRQLEKLKKENKKIAAEQLEVLTQRLDAADALMAGNPERAKDMYRAVVTLYADKPWAQDLVRRAAPRLRRSDPLGAASSPLALWERGRG